MTGVPTSSDYLEALPALARIAFVARCARRLQSALAAARDPRQGAVERLLGLVEEVASGEDIPSPMLKAAYDAVDLDEDKTPWSAADTAIAAAKHAAVAALFPGSPASAHFAVVYAFLASEASAAQSWQEYERLWQTCQRTAATDLTPVPPSFFGVV